MIKVDSLTYTYPKASAPTLRKLSFEIGQGEIFGFLGPSGAGKSTTQKVMYKTISDFDGSVTIDGTNLKKLGKEYFERIGVGFELPNHYLKLTGKENLELFATFYRQSAKPDIAGLFELVDLQASMNKPVEAYSKGMKMRLNYIRAIMHNPDILFFDEPTAGLDPVNAHTIKQHILKLKSEGKTIFITTHNMNTADELCDKVAFIAEGELRSIDAPAALKAKHGKDVVQVQLSDGNMQEFPLAGLGGSDPFISFIRQGEVRKISTLEATLEEVFIKVTGKELKS